MPEALLNITLHGADIVERVDTNTRRGVAEEIAAALIEQADDEAQRPNRNSVSRAIEQTLRDAAETALRVGGLLDDEAAPDA